MMTARYTKYNGYAGYVIKGEEPIRESPLFNKEKHLHRILLLLSSGIESSTWGTVQSYDGAGISAGLLHHVATLPKQQVRGNAFWALIQEFYDRKLEKIPGVEMRGGVPYDSETGVVLIGDDIRRLFTGTSIGFTHNPPPPGVLERVELIHRLFASKDTRTAQIAAAEGWLVQICRFAPDLNPTVHSPPPGLRRLRTANFVSPELELAACVVRTFAVNNPAAAKSAIKQALPIDADFPMRVYSALQKIRTPWATRFKETYDAVESFGHTFTSAGREQMRKSML